MVEITEEARRRVAADGWLSQAMKRAEQRAKLRTRRVFRKKRSR